MDLNSVAETALTVICSTVGVSFVLKSIFTTSLNNLSDRLTQNHQATLDKQIAAHQLELDKRIETHKSGLDTKTYISKIRFDKEFEVYVELAEKFNDLAYNIANLVYILNHQNDEAIINSLKIKTVDKVEVELNDFMHTYNRYTPFVSTDIYEALREFHISAIKLLFLFTATQKMHPINNSITYDIGHDVFAEPLVGITRKEAIQQFKDISEELHEKRHALNGLIREHLNSLDVRE